MTQFVFRLFVSGEDPRHDRVAVGLKRLLENKCADHCHLDVVDVRRQPELAEQCNILATPTLVRLTPLPALRVVGELAACTRILADLGMCPGEWPSKPEAAGQESFANYSATGAPH